jgi:multidrug efflux system membrane fusion protein
MRPLPVLTALLVVAALYMALIERDALLRFVGLAANATTEPEDEPEATRAALVRVVALRSRAVEIDSRVVLRGETQAMRMVEVRAETSGRVVSPPLRSGAVVAAGDVLCQLDPGTREAELEQARAALAEAEINNSAAQELRERGFAPDTRAAATEAAIHAARAAVERAETELERLTIEAPFDGVLEADTAELGALLQPGSVCATVIELNPIKVVGFVPETLVHRVRLGARAGARLVDGSEVAGEVTFVARSADPQTRTFRVDITVPNPDLAVRDGQTAEIAIAAEADTAHLLPGSALTLNDAGDLGVRTVDDDGMVGFAPVDLIRDTEDGVLVGGLPTRADVIVTGQDFVTEGQQVDATYREPGT